MSVGDDAERRHAAPDHAVVAAAQQRQEVGGVVGDEIGYSVADFVKHLDAVVADAIVIEDMRSPAAVFSPGCALP